MWGKAGVHHKGAGGSGLHLTRIATTLLVCFTLLALALVLTLSGSPLVVAHANATPADEPILEGRSGTGACQEGETLPGGTTAIRLTLVSTVGPQVRVRAFSGTGVIASGAVGSGWTSGAVTVPVKPVSRTVSSVRLCFTLGQSVETVVLGGSKTAAAIAATTRDGRVLPGRFTVEYMRPARSSWWSMGTTIARHIGLGRAPSGTWIVLLLIFGAGALGVGASWLVLKELQ